jgi:chromosome partitioning protein
MPLDISFVFAKPDRERGSAVTQIIAITNQKGGVGKTTTTVNLAASLAAMHRRVLLVDLDPQGNATMGSGIDKHALDTTIYDVLVHGVSVADAIQDAAGGYRVLPANSNLTAAEVELLGLPQREHRLAAALSRIDAVDFVLIDCPPSLNMLTVNALVSAHGVLIPMQCEYYALEGLSALVDTITRVAESVNTRLRIEGLLRTMYDPRNSLTNDVSAQLEQHFGEQLYRTVIPRNVRLAEAPSHGLPVIQYDDKSRGAQAYLALAGEFVRRQESRTRSATSKELG